MKFKILFSALLASIALGAWSCQAASSATGTRHGLNRPELKIAVLPALNKSGYPEAAKLIDKATMAYFAPPQKDLLSGYKTVIISPEEIISHTAARGITLNEIYPVPENELGKELGVDFILRNEVTFSEDETINLAFKYGYRLQGRTRIIECASRATIVDYTWRIDGRGIERQAGSMSEYFTFIMLDSTVSSVAGVDKYARCIKGGFPGILNMAILHITQPSAGVK